MKYRNKKYKNKNIYLPQNIILNKLVGSPQKVEMPIYGGIDTATFTIVNFSIKYVQWAKVSLNFVDKTIYYEGFDFVYGGIELASTKQAKKLVERKYQREMSILNQAIKILMAHKNLSNFRKALEDHLLIRSSESVL